MRRIFRISLLSITVASLISKAHAGSTWVQKSGAQKSDEDYSKSQGMQIYGSTGQTFTGTFVKIDSGKVTIRTWDNHEKQFSVDEKTAVTLSSTDARLSDLQPGQQVILTAEGGKAVAISLSTTDLRTSVGSASGSVVSP